MLRRVLGPMLLLLLAAGVGTRPVRGCHVVGTVITPVTSATLITPTVSTIQVPVTALTAPVLSTSVLPVLQPALIQSLSTFPVSYQQLFLTTLYGPRVGALLFERHFGPGAVRVAVRTSAGRPVRTVVKTRPRKVVRRRRR